MTRAFPPLALAALALAACTPSAVTTEIPVEVNGKLYKVIKTDYTSSVSDEVNYSVIVNGQVFDCNDMGHCYDLIQQQTGAPPAQQVPASTTSGTTTAPKFDGAD